MKQLNFTCDYCEENADRLYEVRIVRKLGMEVVPGSVPVAELCHMCWRRMVEGLREQHD